MLELPYYFQFRLTPSFHKRETVPFAADDVQVINSLNCDLPPCGYWGDLDGVHLHVSDLPSSFDDIKIKVQEWDDRVFQYDGIRNVLTQGPCDTVTRAEVFDQLKKVQAQNCLLFDGSLPLSDWYNVNQKKAIVGATNTWASLQVEPITKSWAFPDPNTPEQFRAILITDKSLWYVCAANRTDVETWEGDPVTWSARGVLLLKCSDGYIVAQKVRSDLDTQSLIKDCHLSPILNTVLTEFDLVSRGQLLIEELIALMIAHVTFEGIVRRADDMRGASAPSADPDADPSQITYVVESSHTLRVFICQPPIGGSPLMRIAPLGSDTFKTAVLI